MRNYIKSILISVALVSAAPVLAEDVVVIVNAANAQSLSKADIKAIYSDNIIAWSNGQAIVSFDLPVKNEAREGFSRAVLGLSASDAAREWANRKITNTAKNPPRTKPENLVVLSVSKDPNAIGYVPASAAQGKSGIKVLMTLN